MNHSTSRRSFLMKSAMATTGLSLLSASSISAFTVDTPFDGYNPFADEKTDLRKNLFGNETMVRGRIYDHESLTPLSNVLIEVWHMSTESGKYRHRAKLYTNDAGEYSFITDFPSAQQYQCPRIFFKVSKGESTAYTELLMNDRGPFITSKHWEEHQILGEKTQPEFTKFLNRSTIDFNITIN